jgi:hypothetical protein
MNTIAARVKSLADANPTWMSLAMRKELSFLGADNIANLSAIENLIAMGQRKGSEARYLRYGQKTGLERLLPGVKVHVLGPPDLTQTNAIRRQRSRDRDQFWHLVRGTVPSSTAGQIVSAADRPGGPAIPAGGRWFRDRLRSLGGQELLEIVRQLDQQMNNTSLILLFEAKGKKLLFPGDAQLENWSYALQEAKECGKVRKMLAGVDFYKVGHHGSLNATPRTLLWENFDKRTGRHLLTMMSTLHGKHGKTTSRTEVPRKTLVAALESGSRLKTTESLKAAELEHLTIL